MTSATPHGGKLTAVAFSSFVRARSADSAKGQLSVRPSGFLFILRTGEMPSLPQRGQLVAEAMQLIN